MYTRAKKSISVCLVAVLLTQIALADTTQSSFWTERRQNIDKTQESNRVLVASLPSSLGNPEEVFRQLPSPSITRSLAFKSEDPQGSSSQNGIVDSLIAALPAAYGTIRETDLPIANPNQKKKTVIIIQDVHMNQEAQDNIEKTIQELMNQNAVGVIGLEGSTRPIDLERLRSFPDPDVTRKVADYFLKTNQISGPIYAGLTSDKKTPAFVGVDDPIHYKANVEAYQQSADKQDPYKIRLADLKRELAREKNETFNPDLKTFDENVEAYREGKIKLGGYLKFLSGHVSTTPFSVKTFINALEMEQKLNFSQVEKERSEVLEKLVGKLGKDNVMELIRESLAYRLGRVSHAQFYAYLRDLCQRSRIPLSRYPAMDSYIRYVLLSDSIKGDALFRDINRMEEEGYADLAKTGKERELIAKSKWLYLTGKLVDFSLATQEWGDYKALPLSESEKEKWDVASFQSFYKEAEIRNHSIIANLLKAMDNHMTSVGVLVAGGFHSEGIREILRELHINLIVFVPKITKVDAVNGSKYLSVFTQEKTPLEKLFEGEKLFLASNPISEGTIDEMLLALIGTSRVLEREGKEEKPLTTDTIKRLVTNESETSIPSQRAESVSGEFVTPQGHEQITATTSLTGDDDIIDEVKPSVATPGAVGGFLASVGVFFGRFLPNILTAVASRWTEIKIGAYAGVTETFRVLNPLFWEQHNNVTQWHANIRKLGQSLIYMAMFGAGIAAPYLLANHTALSIPAIVAITLAIVLLGNILAHVGFNTAIILVFGPKGPTLTAIGGTEEDQRPVRLRDYLTKLILGGDPTKATRTVHMVAATIEFERQRTKGKSLDVAAAAAIRVLDLNHEINLQETMDQMPFFVQNLGLFREFLGELENQHPELHREIHAAYLGALLLVINPPKDVHVDLVSLDEIEAAYNNPADLVEAVIRPENLIGQENGNTLYRVPRLNHYIFSVPHGVNASAKIGELEFLEGNSSRNTAVGQPIAMIGPFTLLKTPTTSGPASNHGLMFLLGGIAPHGIGSAPVLFASQGVPTEVALVIAGIAFIVFLIAMNSVSTNPTRRSRDWRGFFSNDDGRASLRTMLRELGAENRFKEAQTEALLRRQELRKRYPLGIPSYIDIRVERKADGTIAVSAVATRTITPASIYRDDFLYPRATRTGKIKSWLGNPENSPKWEWVFQASVPIVLTTWSLFSLPTIVGFSLVGGAVLFGTVVFGGLHYLDWKDKLILMNVGFIFTLVAAFLPAMTLLSTLFLPPHAQWVQPIAMTVATILGIWMNIRVHTFYNRAVEDENYGDNNAFIFGLIEFIEDTLDIEMGDLPAAAIGGTNPGGGENPEESLIEKYGRMMDRIAPKKNGERDFSRLTASSVEITDLISARDVIRKIMITPQVNAGPLLKVYLNRIEDELMHRYSEISLLDQHGDNFHINSLWPDPEGMKRFSVKYATKDQALDEAKMRFLNEATKKRLPSSAGAEDEPSIIKQNVDKIFSDEFIKVYRRESMGGNAGGGYSAVNGVVDSLGRIVAFGNSQNFSWEVEQAIRSARIFTFTIRVKADKRMEGPDYDLYVDKSIPEKVRRILEESIQGANARKNQELKGAVGKQTLPEDIRNEVIRRGFDENVFIGIVDEIETQLIEQGYKKDDFAHYLVSRGNAQPASGYYDPTDMAIQRIIDSAIDVKDFRAGQRTPMNKIIVEGFSLLTRVIQRRLNERENAPPAVVLPAAIGGPGKLSDDEAKWATKQLNIRADALPQLAQMIDEIVTGLRLNDLGQFDNYVDHVKFREDRLIPFNGSDIDKDIEKAVLSPTPWKTSRKIRPDMFDFLREAVRRRLVLRDSPYRRVEETPSAPAEQAAPVASVNLEKKIKDAKNINELIVILRENGGGIQGSTRFYPVDELSLLVDNTRKDEHQKVYPIVTITPVLGLRRRVAELLLPESLSFEQLYAYLDAIGTVKGRTPEQLKAQINAIDGKSDLKKREELENQLTNGGDLKLRITVMDLFDKGLRPPPITQLTLPIWAKIFSKNNVSELSSKEKAIAVTAEEALFKWLPHALLFMGWIGWPIFIGVQIAFILGHGRQGMMVRSAGWMASWGIYSATLNMLRMTPAGVVLAAILGLGTHQYFNYRETNRTRAQKTESPIKSKVSDPARYLQWLEEESEGKSVPKGMLEDLVKALNDFDMRIAQKLHMPWTKILKPSGIRERLRRRAIMANMYSQVGFKEEKGQVTQVLVRVVMPEATHFTEADVFGDEYQGKIERKVGKDGAWFDFTASVEPGKAVLSVTPAAKPAAAGTPAHPAPFSALTDGRGLMVAGTFGAVAGLGVTLFSLISGSAVVMGLSMGLLLVGVGGGIIIVGRNEYEASKPTNTNPSPQKTAAIPNTTAADETLVRAESITPKEGEEVTVLEFAAPSVSAKPNREPIEYLKGPYNQFHKDLVDKIKEANNTYAYGKEDWKKAVALIIASVFYTLSTTALQNGETQKQRDQLIRDLVKSFQEWNRGRYKQAFRIAFDSDLKKNGQTVFKLRSFLTEPQKEGEKPLFTLKVTKVAAAVPTTKPAPVAVTPAPAAVTSPSKTAKSKSAETTLKFSAKEFFGDNPANVKENVSRKLRGFINEHQIDLSSDDFDKLVESLVSFHSQLMDTNKIKGRYKLPGSEKIRDLFNDPLNKLNAVLKFDGLGRLNVHFPDHEGVLYYFLGSIRDDGWTNGKEFGKTGYSHGTSGITFNVFAKEKASVAVAMPAPAATTNQELAGLLKNVGIILKNHGTDKDRQNELSDLFTTLIFRGYFNLTSSDVKLLRRELKVLAETYPGPFSKEIQKWIGTFNNKFGIDLKTMVVAAQPASPAPSAPVVPAKETGDTVIGLGELGKGETDTLPLKAPATQAPLRREKTGEVVTYELATPLLGASMALSFAGFSNGLALAIPLAVFAYILWKTLPRTKSTAQPASPGKQGRGMLAAATASVTAGAAIAVVLLGLGNIWLGTTLGLAFFGVAVKLRNSGQNTPAIAAATLLPFQPVFPGLTTLERPAAQIPAAAPTAEEKALAQNLVKMALAFVNGQGRENPVDLLNGNLNLGIESIRGPGEDGTFNLSQGINIPRLTAELKSELEKTSARGQITEPQARALVRVFMSWGLETDISKLVADKDLLVPMSGTLKADIKKNREELEELLNKVSARENGETRTLYIVVTAKEKASYDKMLKNIPSKPGVQLILKTTNENVINPANNDWVLNADALTAVITNNSLNPSGLDLIINPETKLPAGAATLPLFQEMGLILLTDILHGMAVKVMNTSDLDALDQVARVISTQA